jgi:hypothetical protein
VHRGPPIVERQFHQGAVADEALAEPGILRQVACSMRVGGAPDDDGALASVERCRGGPAAHAVGNQGVA